MEKDDYFLNILILWGKERIFKCDGVCRFYGGLVRFCDLFVGWI